MMPINRPDGRHWCAPEREPVPESGEWECPDCETVWVLDGNVWSKKEES